ncbi:MAG: hypothetical protein ACRC2T_01385, partial [Thermoguttaceae bacterium]
GTWLNGFLYTLYEWYWGEEIVLPYLYAGKGYMNSSGSPFGFEFGYEVAPKTTTIVAMDAVMVPAGSIFSNGNELDEKTQFLWNTLKASPDKSMTLRLHFLERMGGNHANYLPDSVLDADVVISPRKQEEIDAIRKIYVPLRKKTEKIKYPRPLMFNAPVRDEKRHVFGSINRVAVRALDLASDKQIEQLESLLPPSGLRDVFTVNRWLTPLKEVMTGIHYQSPPENFWKWFDQLPELERQFLTLEIFRGYCRDILFEPYKMDDGCGKKWYSVDDDYPEVPESIFDEEYDEETNTYTINPENTIEKHVIYTMQEQGRLREQKRAIYMKDRDIYDRFFADWLKRLPKDSAYVNYIVGQLDYLDIPAVQAWQAKGIQPVEAATMDEKVPNAVQ